MGNPKKTTSEEGTARASLPSGRLDADEMVTMTNQMTQIMKQAPGWATNQPVQTAVTTWGTAADVVDKGQAAIQAAQLTLVALQATQVKNIAAWSRAKLTVLASVNQASGGSAEGIKQWGLQVLQHQPVVTTNDAPTALRALYDKQLDLVLTWKGAKGQRGYLVQIGDGTPTGWGTPVASTKPRLVPTGLTPGQKIVVRVAVVRTSGQSPWSDPLSLTVR